MRLERGQRLSSRHVRHEPQVELGDRAMRKDGLSARTGIAPDQPLDVDGRPRRQPGERIAPGNVVRPVTDPELLFRIGFALPLRRRVDHRLLLGREPPRLVGESINGWVGPVRRHQRGEGLHQVESGAVDAGPIP